MGGLCHIEKEKNVGFIGLGNMGRGMAGNLVKAGHNVTTTIGRRARTRK